MLLRYEYGKLYWRIDRSRGVKSGDRAGTLRHDGYRSLTCYGKVLSEHRVIWAMYYGAFPLHTIDHINGIKDDNRIENMRDLTRSENQRAYKTKPIGSSSQYRGVHYSSRDRVFIAAIKLGESKKYLGSFQDESSAARAYDRAAIEHGFDVQALNFPERKEIT